MGIILIQFPRAAQKQEVETKSEYPTILFARFETLIVLFKSISLRHISILSTIIFGKKGIQTPYLQSITHSAGSVYITTGRNFYGSYFPPLQKLG